MVYYGVLCCVAYTGMQCDLDKTPDRMCILRSPLTRDSFNWTCMYVEYHLSSHDVILTLDLLVDGVSNITYTLSASQNAEWIWNPDLESSFSVEFTASRYLVSSDDFEYAVVTSVEFRSCSADTGMCERKYAISVNQFCSEICIFCIHAFTLLLILSWLVSYIGLGDHPWPSFCRFVG